MFFGGGRGVEERIGSFICLVGWLVVFCGGGWGFLKLEYRLVILFYFFIFCYSRPRILMFVVVWKYLDSCIGGCKCIELRMYMYPELSLAWYLDEWFQSHGRVRYGYVRRSVRGWLLTWHFVLS